MGAGATFVLMLASTLPYPLLEPFVVDRLGGGTAGASLYVSVNLAAYVLFAPLWGRLVDRGTNRRLLAGAGLMGQAGLLALQPAIGSLGLLLLVRFAEGAFTVLAMTTLHATVLDWAEARGRGGAIGTVGMGLALGVAAGAALGGLLGEQALGLPFLVGGTLLGAAAVGTFALVRDPPTTRERAGALAGLALLRGSPGLVPPTLLAFLDRLTVGFLVAVLPLHFGAQDVGPARIGALLSSFLLVFGLFQFPFGRLSDRIGRRGLVAGGSLAYGAFLVAIPHLGFPGLFALMAAGGLVGAAMFAPTFALVGDHAPRGRTGAAVALFHQAGSLGFAIGPVAGGAILAALGAERAFLGVGLVEAAAALVLAVVWWTRARAGDGR